MARAPGRLGGGAGAGLEQGKTGEKKREIKFVQCGVLKGSGGK